MLEKPKKKSKSSRPGTSSSKHSKSKGKNKEGSTSEKIDDGNNFNYEISKSSSEDEENSEKEVDRPIKMMNELENRLKAIEHRDNLQEVGVVRLYLVEWDTSPYPLKFMALTLQTFDGKGFPNQHIYYFKSQTGNVVSNDAIMAHLFIGTSRGLPSNSS